MQRRSRGRAYVLGDDIDTDQIIPAHYLTTQRFGGERKVFGGPYALRACRPPRRGFEEPPFVPEGGEPGEYRIVVGGKNFGCGSSREHAPLALREAGVEAVIAVVYARIFFRNSVNGGYLLPFETPTRLVEGIRTGDETGAGCEGSPPHQPDHRQRATRFARWAISSRSWKPGISSPTRNRGGMLA